MSNKIKILIVEDEALIAENLKLTLEDLGYEVSGICYNYFSALEKIRENAADLVLLDINLSSKDPQEDGLALGAIITKDYGTPFIFLTAYSDRDTITEATKLYPGSYLIKPVNAAALFAAIQTTIEHSNLKASQHIPQQNTIPDYFFVKIGSKNHKLMWDQVYCIESGKNYVKLKIAGENREYPIRGTLTFVMDQLVPELLRSSFIRISRSTCVNKKFITSFNAGEVYCKEEKFENTRYNYRELQELIG